MCEAGERRPQGLLFLGSATPVAGYIYFALEKKKDAKYELEYKLNGKSVVLPL